MPREASPNEQTLKRLTYWVCASRSGNARYNIRAKTWAEAMRLRAEHGLKEYAPPAKVILTYRDTFHLLCELSSECSLLAREPRGPDES